MASWFPALRTKFAEKLGFFRFLKPYPYTSRTLLGALYATLAAILLCLVLFASWWSLSEMIKFTYSGYVHIAAKFQGPPPPTDPKQKPTEQASRKTSSSRQPLPVDTKALEQMQPHQPKLPADAQAFVRAPIGKSPLPYREQDKRTLTDGARQIEFALLQTILRLQLPPSRWYLLTSERRAEKQDTYYFQRLRLYLPEGPDAFLDALDENLRVWAERGSYSREQNKIFLNVDGVRTHEIWFDTISNDNFVAPPPPKSPRMTIVIDDMGESPKAAQAILSLPYPVTIAIWPYSRLARETAETAHKVGREILIHQPMQPMQSPYLKAGKGELKVAMSPAQISETLKECIARVPHAVGLNNHMGSRLTSDPAASAQVCKVVSESGLFLLDSLTHPQSILFQTARSQGLPAYRRAVFLDDGVRSEQSVLKKLKETERIALEQGQAIAIGHPHPETIAALKRWSLQRSSSVYIVPLRYLDIPTETFAEPGRLSHDVNG